MRNGDCMKKFVIGEVRRLHGVHGALKISMYYPYSKDVLLKYGAYIADRFFDVNEVFGIVKDCAILKLEAVDSFDLASELKGQAISVEIPDDVFYSVHFIGSQVFRGEDLIGEVLDISWTNDVEYLDLATYLIPIDQILGFKGGKIFI